MKIVRPALFIGIAAVCFLGFIFPYEHPHFWWQKLPVFDAIFGFVGCIIIILFAKGIGHYWLKRDEDYYD